MARSAWILELGKTHWRLWTDDQPDGPPLEPKLFDERDLAAQAAPIHEALKASGYRSEPIVLALESCWCLAARIVVTRPQELRERQTMLYRFEEQVPWGVEESVVDYLAAGTSALLVAVPIHPLVEFLERLETADVFVQSIVPVALLATVEHLSRGDWSVDHVVAFEHNESIDLVVVENGRTTAWHWLPAMGAGLREELHHRALEAGNSMLLIGYGIRKTVIDRLANSADPQLVSEPIFNATPSASLALSAATRILSGRLDSPIDLKRGPFGMRRGNVALRRYWLALQSAAAILIATTACAFLYRGHALNQQAERVSVKHAEIFRSVFPNAKVPIGIRSRLDSELAKLKGLKGDDSTVPNTTSATVLLHRLLTALPADRRFRLLEIRIEEERLYLDGEVREHGDAETIAQQLRAQGFEIPSPRTQRLDDQRVSLRITGTLTSHGTLAARTTK